MRGPSICQPSGADDSISLNPCRRPAGLELTFHRVSFPGLCEAEYVKGRWMGQYLRELPVFATI